MTSGVEQALVVAKPSPKVRFLPLVEAVAALAAAFSRFCLEARVASLQQMAPSQSVDGLSSERLLVAAVALLAADRDERTDDAPVRRSELVLTDAGFSVTEIAAMTGKSFDTVRGTVRRAAGRSASPRGRQK